MEPSFSPNGWPVRRTVLALAACLALVAVTLLGTSRAQAHPNLDQISRQFEAVALGHEHGRETGILQKWNQDLRLALFAAPGWDLGPYLSAIGQHIRAIEKLTGIRVRPASSINNANLRFGFYPRAEFSKMPGQQDDPEFRRWVETSACIALAVGDGKATGQIQAGAIAIGTDIPENQRQHCILEELVQVLGLPNDACHYRPSLFCEGDRVFALTPADTLLLRALYDRRLASGMPREQAVPIARQVLAELMPSMMVPQPIRTGFR